ncbi:MAG TPA: hydrolase Nlp/P60, partial [Flavobacteriaceae bacterium]|nr:hydrolase Nlp/P60 [Flavobacteriaceae bacterium]
HVYGKVRIDRIDHTGIFNPQMRQYTHSLRVIKHIERP